MRGEKKQGGHHRMIRVVRLPGTSDVDDVETQLKKKCRPGVAGGAIDEPGE